MCSAKILADYDVALQTVKDARAQNGHILQWTRSNKTKDTLRCDIFLSRNSALNEKLLNQEKQFTRYCNEQNQANDKLIKDVTRFTIDFKLLKVPIFFGFLEKLLQWLYVEQRRSICRAFLKILSNRSKINSLLYLFGKTRLFNSIRISLNYKLFCRSILNWRNLVLKKKYYKNWLQYLLGRYNSVGIGFLNCLDRMKVLLCKFSSYLLSIESDGSTSTHVNSAKKSLLAWIELLQKQKIKDLVNKLCTQYFLSRILSIWREQRAESTQTRIRLIKASQLLKFIENYLYSSRVMKQRDFRKRILIKKARNSSVNHYHEEFRNLVDTQMKKEVIELKKSYQLRGCFHKVFLYEVKPVTEEVLKKTSPIAKILKFIKIFLHNELVQGIQLIWYNFEKKNMLLDKVIGRPTETINTIEFNEKFSIVSIINYDYFAKVEYIVGIEHVSIKSVGCIRFVTNFRTTPFYGVRTKGKVKRIGFYRVPSWINKETNLDIYKDQEYFGLHEVVNTLSMNVLRLGAINFRFLHISKISIFSFYYYLFSSSRSLLPIYKLSLLVKERDSLKSFLSYRDVDEFEETQEFTNLIGRRAQDIERLLQRSILFLKNLKAKYGIMFSLSTLKRLYEWFFISLSKGLFSDENEISYTTVRYFNSLLHSQNTFSRGKKLRATATASSQESELYD